MRVWRWVLAAATVAVVGLGWCARSCMAQDAPRVGQPAPAFELPGTDGKTWRLEDLKGRSWVVLAWYPKAFTPGCTTECKAFHESRASFQDYQVQVFGASVDTPEKNAEFAAKYSLGFPLLSDPDRKVARAYGVLMPVVEIARRWTFVIDPEGTVRAVVTDVKPATAGADLARLLQELGVPKRS